MRSFTLFEAIISLIIIAIISSILANFISSLYKSSFKDTKIKDELIYALNLIANRLEYSIENSLIEVKCKLNRCKDGIIEDYKPLSNNNYQILEWLGEDIYSKRGIFKDNMSIGYSGVVDINRSTYSTILSPLSNFYNVKIIDSNWTKAWGIKGDIFLDKLEVLLFVGEDKKGEIDQINNSYGYYFSPAKKIYSINPITENKISISHITPDLTKIFERYYLINSAYALVPICSGDCKEFNLTLFFNYYPWKKEIFKDGNSSIIATNITKFEFKKDKVLTLKICKKAKEKEICQIKNL